MVPDARVEISNVCVCVLNVLQDVWRYDVAAYNIDLSASNVFWLIKFLRLSRRKTEYIIVCMFVRIVSAQEYDNLPYHAAHVILHKLPITLSFLLLCTLNWVVAVLFDVYTYMF